MTSTDLAPPRVAYLCGMYPSVSLTFITREIEALRALGVEVLTCSVRKTPPSEHTGPVEKAHAASNFHVIETASRPARALSAMAWALGRPRQLAATLKLAWHTRGPGLRAGLLQIAYMAEAVVLAHHLKRAGVGHLHNHFVSASATVAMLTARLADIPFSYTLHGPTDFFEPLRWHIGKKTAEAAFVACISHYCRSQCMLFSDPATWDRLKVVHCGVEPARYDQPRAARHGPGPVELLFVGRLARVKGLLVLFEALGRLGEGPDMRLTVVGDGPDREELERAAASLGDKVRFVGAQSQDAVAARLTEADLLVLPSFAEGVPVVLMEAMAAHLPVVATRVAGVPELVEDGVSGLLVPPGDVASLAEAIAALATDPDRRAAMGAAGRSRVVAEFDIAAAAAQLRDLFAASAAKGGAV